MSLVGWLEHHRDQRDRDDLVAGIFVQTPLVLLALPVLNGLTVRR